MKKLDKIVSDCYVARCMEVLFDLAILNMGDDFKVEKEQVERKYERWANAIKLINNPVER